MGGGENPRRTPYAAYGIADHLPEASHVLSREGHKIYPYLLKTVNIAEPGQVYAADITYIPMERGFLYLVAVIDWKSRKAVRNASRWTARGAGSERVRGALLAQPQAGGSLPACVRDGGRGQKGIAAYVRYFNEERPHQGLDNLTPDDVYYRRKPLPKAA